MPWTEQKMDAFVLRHLILWTFYGILVQLCQWWEGPLVLVCITYSVSRQETACFAGIWMTGEEALCWACLPPPSSLHIQGYLDQKYYFTWKIYILRYRACKHTYSMVSQSCSILSYYYIQAYQIFKLSYQIFHGIYCILYIVRGQD